MALRAWVCLALANALLGIGILTFAKAFFPYKPFLPGLAVFDAPDESIAPAHFDKLVFMVVDALRSDFVYTESSGFKFTQSLIASGKALPFTAFASAPTVTMPKVKALTTGSIPGFLDMILNIAESDTSSTLATQDNWLAQLRASGKNLNMFGDDTWLKLFPDMFMRTDGTTSFFVSDFTEVDNNVTRHIDQELEKDDWDVMILHYLGLDHIGHKSGPHSSFMVPKQIEMDGIVQKIFSSAEKNEHLQSTLFVLCGDHGMNDVGNHGGSSAGETSAALVLMSPKFGTISKGVDSPLPVADDFRFYENVQQSDLAPTLAGLLKFPTPKNNLGLFIPSLLPLWNETDQELVLWQNARQLMRVLQASFPDFESMVTESICSEEDGSDVDRLACAWHQLSGLHATKGSSQSTIVALSKFSRDCQKFLASMATNYDTVGMTYGVLAGCTSLFLLWISLVLSSASFKYTFYSLCFWSLTLAYGGMMFASSYVEEEQHYWYWSASAWIVILFIQEKKRGSSGMKSFLVLCLLRVTRRWNQTGQKFAGAPDIAKDFLTKNPTVLWVLVIGSYIELYNRLSRSAFKRITPQLGVVFSAATTLLSATFKLSMAAQDAAELIPRWLIPVTKILKSIPVIDQGKAGFLSLFWIFMYTVVFERQANTKTGLNNPQVFHDLLSILLATQSRITNIPLLLIFSMQLRILLYMKNFGLYPATLTTLVFQHLSFFALGNSNAISSIDLSNAYNGVSDYDVGVVGLLTFISNWAGPIWWTSAGCLLLHSIRLTSERSGRNLAILYSEKLSRFYVISAIFIMGACTALKTHLFIWTVFSPKYLYAMAWSIIQHGVINMLLGNALFAATG